MIWFCEAKKFRRKIVTKPSKAWIFSMAENNDILEGSPLKVFGSMTQKNIDRNSWYSPFISIDFFAAGKILKHSTEGLLYETFRHCETKIFRGKSWYFPLPFIHKQFRNQKNSETQHRGVPQRNASVLWDKQFSMENLDTPPFLSFYFFANGKFLKHSTEGLLYELFRYCETKCSRWWIVT